MINSQNGHVTLFGEIELEKCLATYGYWNYWILHGFLKVDVLRKRIKFKVTTTSSNFLRAAIILTEARLRVITLKELNIDISGLGIFSWVADQIEAIVENVYKTDVARLLTERLNKNLQQLVEKSPHKGHNKV